MLCSKHEQKPLKKACKGDNAVLALNCHANFLSMGFEFKLIWYKFHIAAHQLGKLFQNRSNHKQVIIC